MISFLFFFLPRTHAGVADSGSSFLFPPPTPPPISDLQASDLILFPTQFISDSSLLQQKNHFHKFCPLETGRFDCKFRSVWIKVLDLMNKFSVPEESQNFGISESWVDYHQSPWIRRTPEKPQNLRILYSEEPWRTWAKIPELWILRTPKPVILLDLNF